LLLLGKGRPRRRDYIPPRRRKAMHFKIGDFIHRRATNEQGRIVRLLKSGKSVGYVVLTINSVSEREIEAVWFSGEIKEIYSSRKNGS
jgi:hypothetical protein